MPRPPAASDISTVRFKSKFRMIFFIVVATNGEGRSLYSFQQHNSSGMVVVKSQALWKNNTDGFSEQKKGPHRSFDFQDFQDSHVKMYSGHCYFGIRSRTC